MKRISFLQRFKIPVYDDPDQVQYADLDFDTENCMRCGSCVTACAFGFIAIDGYYRSDYLSGNIRGKKGFPKLVTSLNRVSQCVGCLTCAAACPKDAISIKRPFRAELCLEKIHQTSKMTLPKRH